MYTILLTVHVCICLALIAFILLQQGRSVTAGLMGSGASQTVFGSQGTKGFLQRATSFLAAGFFIVSLLLAAYNTRLVKGTDVQPEGAIPAPIVPIHK